jgi:ATP-binding cassette subfamily A (ABC1) protein 3
VLNDTYMVRVSTSLDRNSPRIERLVPVRAPVSVLHNTSSYHALPSFANELTLARWRVLLGKERGSEARDRARYDLFNHPLPLTRQGELRVQAILSLFAAVFVLVPFCYLPASFVIFVVRERASKAKHQQLVSGANPTVYWLSTFAWDVCNYMVIVFAVMLVFLAYGNAEFVGTSEMVGATFLLLVMYGLSVLPLSYCLSFAFDNSTSAQIAIASFHFLTGFVLKMADFVLGQVEDTRAVNAQLRTYLYRFFPPFNLGEGLVAMSTVGFEATITGRRKSPFERGVIGENLIWMGVEVVGFFLLTLALEADLLRVGRALEWWRTRGAGRDARVRPVAAANANALGAPKLARCGRRARCGDRRRG